MNISILNNTFLNLTSDAVRCQDHRDVLVQGNQFTNVYVGIHAFSDVNQVCDNFRVVANMFSAMSRGTTFNGGSTTERNIRQVSFVGNVVDRSTSYGITADYAKGVAYADNIVRSCGGFGIWIWKQAEVSLTGNRLIDNNTIGLATGGDLGIGGNAQATVGETSDVTVAGNTIGDVYVYSGTRIIFFGNTIRTSYRVSSVAPAPTSASRSVFEVVDASPVSRRRTGETQHAESHW